MDTFYVAYNQFWEWFDRPNDNFTSEAERYIGQRQKTKSQRMVPDMTTSPSSGMSAYAGSKRMKTESNKPRSIVETEAFTRTGCRYIIMYARHKPGKKNKVWEDDGYLSLVGQMAHLCDLKGRMLEEPTLLDEIDYKSVEDLGELIIGNTEVQVVELDKP